MNLEDLFEKIADAFTGNNGMVAVSSNGMTLEQFVKETINKEAEKDSFFKFTILKKSKSVDGCMKYICKKMMEKAISMDGAKVAASLSDNSDVAALAIEYYKSDDEEKVMPAPQKPSAPKKKEVQLSLFDEIMGECNG